MLLWLVWTFADQVDLEFTETHLPLLLQLKAWATLTAVI